MNQPHSTKELVDYAMREVDRERIRGASRRGAIRTVARRHKIDPHKLAELYRLQRVA